ncbi:MAG TPA: peptide chain release factor N(5)-glutamine methyltransferase [Pyrinomonadaceae bacterium]|jgi:release factor glutamine methyltransferase|nr:peptide chain release factor N(5)-glutamine methyltransferase [Pyrinomonadaceae bacterium]
MTISIADAIQQASQILRKAGVPESHREAGSLLAHVIHRDRTFLLSHAEDQLDPEQFSSFRDSVERRSTGEPLQYITGLQDFYGREFRVSPEVLIPRPETELLVAAALEFIGESEAIICDIGTGSGCIAVTLLCERPNARGVAVDVTAPALEIARQNAIDKGVDDRLTFTLSDCFESLPQDALQFDLIISNPPYVAADVISGLQREVKDHEPMVALSPGPDGLSIIRRLIEDAPSFLRKDGHLILEIGFDQGEAVERLVDNNDWKLIDILPDLQRIPRIVILQRE